MMAVANLNYYKNAIIYCGLLAFVLVTTVSCGSEQATYKQEAKAFCEVHNPENWKDFAKTGSPGDLETELNKRIDKVVKTKAFKGVVAELNKVEFMRELYPTAQTKISELIGEKWECPYYQEFYSVSFERQPGEVMTTEIDKDTVVIGIDAQGNYTVNSMELMDNEPQTLKDAIKTVAATTPPKVVVKTSENTPKSALESALEALAEMGVKKARIITP